MEPRNRLQGIDSVSLCSLAGQYENSIPTWFLAPIDCSKFQHWVFHPETVFKEGHSVSDHMPELTITEYNLTLCRLRSRLQQITMGNPMPESNLSPSQGQRIPIGYWKKCWRRITFKGFLTLKEQVLKGVGDCTLFPLIFFPSVSSEHFQ